MRDEIIDMLSRMSLDKIDDYIQDHDGDEDFDGEDPDIYYAAGLSKYASGDEDGAFNYMLQGKNNGSDKARQWLIDNGYSSIDENEELDDAYDMAEEATEDTVGDNIPTDSIDNPTPMSFTDALPDTNVDSSDDTEVNWDTYRAMSYAELSDLANQDDEIALCQLAWEAFEKGRIFRDSARTYLKRALNMAETASVLYCCGILYEKIGDEEEKNPEKDYKNAYEAYGRAAELRYIPAYRKTAKMLETGKGCERNPERAVEFRRKAAQLGKSMDRYRFALTIMKDSTKVLDAYMELEKIMQDEATDEEVRQLCRQAIEAIDNEDYGFFEKEAGIAVKTETSLDDTVTPTMEKYAGMAKYELQQRAMNDDLYAIMEIAVSCLNSNNGSEGYKYLKKAHKIAMEYAEGRNCPSEIREELPVLLYNIGLECEQPFPQDAYRAMQKSASLGFLPAIREQIYMLDKEIGCTRDEDALFEMRNSLVNRGEASAEDMLFLIRYMYEKKNYFGASAYIEKAKQEMISFSDTESAELDRYEAAINARVAKENAASRQEEARKLFDMVTYCQFDALEAYLQTNKTTGIVNVPLYSYAKTADGETNESARNEVYCLLQMADRYHLGNDKQKATVIKMLDLMLDAGADINVKNKYYIKDDEKTGDPIYNEYGILYYADRTDLTLAQYLIDRGANVNEKEQTMQDTGTLMKDTILIEAIAEENRRFVELLLNSGADPNLQYVEIIPNKKHYVPPLIYAMTFEELDSAKLLIAHGADLHLHYKIIHGETDDKKAGTIEKIQPLLTALQRESELFLKLLLENGVDVELDNKQYGYSSIEYCVANAKPKHLELLLEHGADVTQRISNPGEWKFARDEGWDECGILAFAMLQESVDLNTIDVLLNGGANPNEMMLMKSDKQMEIPVLFYAVWKGLKQTTEKLVKAGADPNELRGKVENDGFTLLDFIVSYNKGFDTDVINILFDNGMELVDGDVKTIVNSKNPDILRYFLKNRNTQRDVVDYCENANILPQYIRNAETELAIILIENRVGINKSYRGEFGNDVLDLPCISWAAVLGNMRVLQALIYAGADIDADGIVYEKKKKQSSSTSASSNKTQQKFEFTIDGKRVSKETFRDYLTSLPYDKFKMVQQQVDAVSSVYIYYGSPLIFALLYNQINAACLLLDAGANTSNRGALWKDGAKVQSEKAAFDDAVQNRNNYQYYENSELCEYFSPLYAMMLSQDENETTNELAYKLASKSNQELLEKHVVQSWGGNGNGRNIEVIAPPVVFAVIKNKFTRPIFRNGGYNLKQMVACSNVTCRLKDFPFTTYFGTAKWVVKEMKQGGKTSRW